MPNITIDGSKQTFYSPISAERNKGLLTSDEVGHGQYSSSTQSVEDLYSVVERKLEMAGVLASGTADPVFANETALFYLNTTNNKFFIRGATSYDQLTASHSGANIIGFGTAPGAASATSPWIFVNTTRDTVYVKEQTGGSPPYAWTGPFFSGDSRALLVYNTQTASPTHGPNLSWDWETDTLSASGNGWTENVGNAKWMRVITAARNGSAAIQSPNIRLEDPALSDLEFTAKDGTGTLPSSVNNLQEFIDWINGVTLGGGGGNINQQPSNWNATSGVTRILNKPDVPPFYEEEFGRVSGNIESAGRSQAFTIPTDLTTGYRDKFSQPLFVEAQVKIELQNDPSATTSTYQFDVVGTSVSSDQEEFTADINNPTFHYLRLSGNLPNTVNSGSLRVRRISGTGIAGIEESRITVKPDIKADEVIVNQDDLGNNLTGDSDDLEEIISEIDEIPIQPADYEDVGWPGRPNGIDDDATLDDSTNRKTITFHRNLQNANNRSGITYIAQINYDATEIGSRTDGQTGVNYTHYVYSNTEDPQGNIVKTVIQTTRESTGTTAQQKEHSVIIPSGTISLDVRITSDSNQGDAKLLITNYEINFIQGVNSSGFNGNLATSDNILQKIAQKFDDFTGGGGGTDDQTAAEVSISSTPREAFSDPNIFPGGVRGVNYSGALEAFEANPNDVRAALRSIDFRLQNIYNPFEENEVLDHTDGATTSSDFVLNSSAQIVSNPITIPQELRDLSTDVDIRLRIRVSAIGTGWVGDIQLVHTHYDRQLNPSTVTYGNAESVTRSTKSAGDYVTFERTIQASMVPEQFKVRFRRTGGTTSATFHRGITWVFDSLGSGAMGGVGGQSSSYSSTIIWLAGATINDRIDVASEVTNYDLMSGT